MEEAWKLALAEGDTTLMEVQMRMLGELWEWDRNVLWRAREEDQQYKEGIRKMSTTKYIRIYCKPGTSIVL